MRTDACKGIVLKYESGGHDELVIAIRVSCCLHLLDRFEHEIVPCKYHCRSPEGEHEYRGCRVTDAHSEHKYCGACRTTFARIRYEVIECQNEVRFHRTWAIHKLVTAGSILMPVR